LPPWPRPRPPSRNRRGRRPGSPSVRAARATRRRATPTTLDLVGAPGAPAAFFAFDANYAYFRERIAVDPSNGPGQFINGSWVVLVKTATGDPFEYQYLIALDGNGDQVKLYANDPVTAEPISFSPIFNDPAETQLYTASSTTLSRSVSAGTSITGSANYFVDWAIPRSVLASNGIDPTTSLYWFATSTNSNNYNKGSLDCPFSPTTTMSLTKAAAPTSVSVGQTSPVTYTLTLNNTGTYLANGVTISDSGFPSWLTITNVTSTSGTVSFTASSLEVQIVTLPIGGSATVTVTASANPIAAGSFTNTASCIRDQRGRRHGQQLVDGGGGHEHADPHAHADGHLEPDRHPHRHPHRHRVGDADGEQHRHRDLHRDFHRHADPHRRRPPRRRRPRSRRR
jgi:uncharacterized repeat protein (TIGR01451 family)